jgi:hypothetical protein
MGLFDRFRHVPRTVSDPVFGELEYHESGSWRGDVSFEPAGEEIGVEIVTGGPEPTEAHRQLFVELSQRYRALMPAIGAELLRLFASHPKHDGLPAPMTPRSAEDMARVVQLNWIELRSGGELQLGYGFQPDVDWEDALFTVSIKNWTPSGQSLADGADELADDEG